MKNPNTIRWFASINILLNPKHFLSTKLKGYHHFFIMEKYFKLTIIHVLELV